MYKPKHLHLKFLQFLRESVTGLLYTLVNNSQPLESWQTDPLLEEDQSKAVNTSLGSMFEIYTNATRYLETYYIKGDANTVAGQKEPIANAIKTAYATANNGMYLLLSKRSAMSLGSIL